MSLSKIWSTVWKSLSFNLHVSQEPQPGFHVSYSPLVAGFLLLEIARLRTGTDGDRTILFYTEEAFETL